MARYVMASRRHTTPETRERARDVAIATFANLFEASSQLLGVTQDQQTDPAVVVFEAESEEVLAKQGLVNDGDVLLEPEIPHIPATHPLVDVRIFGSETTARCNGHAVLCWPIR